MNTETSKFEYPLSTQLLLKLGGLAMLIVGFYLFKQSWESENAQMISIIFGVFFSGFGISGLIDGFKKIIISEKSIVQKSPLKQIKMLASDIKGYREVYHSNTKGPNIQLVIFSKNKKQQIIIDKEGWGDHYDFMLKKIKSIYPKVDLKEAKKIKNNRKQLYKNIGKGFGILFFALGIYQFFFLQVISVEDVPELEGIVEAPSLISRFFLMIFGALIFLYYQFLSPGHD